MELFNDGINHLSGSQQRFTFSVPNLAKMGKSYLDSKSYLDGQDLDRQVLPRRASLTWTVKSYVDRQVLPGRAIRTWTGKSYLDGQVLPGRESLTWTGKSTAAARAALRDVVCDDTVFKL